MALSRSAARTARQRRYLWALTACSGAAGLAVVTEQLQERAREHGQTTAEYAQDRAAEAVDAIRKTTGVAGPLLRTAVSAAVSAVQQQKFDSGHFRSEMTATVADLASEAPTRRHLVALGGGYFLDWLLRLAYPPLQDSPWGGSAAAGEGGSADSLQVVDGRDAEGGGVASGSGRANKEGGSTAPRSGCVPGTGTGASDSNLGAQPWSPRPAHDSGLGTTRAERLGAPSAADPDGCSTDDAASGASVAPPQLAAAAAASARLCREAERAVESILQDDVAAGLLLERPGAVPLLLRAVADGRASRGVAAALAARAAEARCTAEAMTADLQEAVEMLRGRSGVSVGAIGGTMALQCTAAGLLSSLAAGSAANRAKLTGLGLQGVLAEVATAVSGLSDRAAVGLQWELLRLSRVMAEHSSESDSHHLAACVLPLLYTAADAAAAGDAAMASYAVDTLAAAVRYGGSPVAEVVSSSTMPHLLWQLAEGLGAHHVLTATAVAADGKDVATAAAAIAAGAPIPVDGKQPAKATATAAASASGSQAKPSRSWFSIRSGSSSAGSAASGGKSGSSPSSASTGGGAAATQAAPATKSRRVMLVQDPAVAASVAAAVAGLARSSLLPEEQVPRWRDWLLDVLCADGFDPGTSAGTGSRTGDSTTSVAGSVASEGLPSGPAVAPLAPTDSIGTPQPQSSLRTQQVPSSLNRREQEQGDSSTVGRDKGAKGISTSTRRAQQQLPVWLALPKRTRQGTTSIDGGGPTAPELQPSPGSPQRGIVAAMQANVVTALSALSHMPGNHGLQAAHYWLSRLLSELAARTLPYTSLVYLEGPRAPQDLIHAVPVLPSYVKTVADALERAADAVAEDSPPLPPHLEFDLAGSGLVARPVHDTQPRRPGGGGGGRAPGASSGSRRGQAAASSKAAGGGVSPSGCRSEVQQQQPQDQQQQAAAAAAAAAAEVAAYRQAAHVVDVVVAERKAADALEALCAIVAPDPDKQRWLLLRGVLPLMHRLTRTADDPRVVLQEQGQPGAERLEQEALEGVDALVAAALDASGQNQQVLPPVRPPTQYDGQTHSAHQRQHNVLVQPYTHHHHYQDRHPQPRSTQSFHQHHQHLREQQQQVIQQSPLEQPSPAAVVSEVMSDHEGGPSLCLQRQVARMLALLALLPDARADLGADAAGRPANRANCEPASVRAAPPTSADWMPWLRHASTSSDCRLSSNATRALLHLAALQVNMAAAAAVTAQATAAAAAGAAGAGLSSSRREATAAAAAATTAAATLPPVFLDGLHLLDPGAQHHWALVRQAAAVAAAEPAMLRTACTAVADAEVACAGTDGLGARTDDSGLPTGAAAHGAAVAMSLETLSTPPPPPTSQSTARQSAHPSEATRGGATAVTMGCGAAVADEGAVVGAGLASPTAPYGLSSAPLAVVTLLSALRYLMSRPMAISNTAALAASYGSSAADSMAAPVPAVAASAGAPPSQSAPEGAPAAATTPAAAMRPGTAGAVSGAVAQPQTPCNSASNAADNSGGAGGAPSGQLPQPTWGAVQARSPEAAKANGLGAPELSDVGAGGSGSRSSGASASGPLIPAAAMPTYPAPYHDLPTDSDSAGGAVQPYAGNAVVAAAPPVTAATATADALPQVDVVFVHGIRGGPFITWRKAGVMTRGSAASHMERSSCWPSTWLAEDIPGARLLSVEYLAPVSAWEGESLPLEDNVSRVMGQLAAAGVGTGQRPVVFVAHSMGGLLVKEMLARSMDQATTGGPLAALAPSTRGIVFFGTPHFGNGIAAMGWKLRHLPGALPAPSLARLTPGPHLLSLNDRLRELHDAQAGSLRVVSMLEGLPTQLSGVIPRILIVAPDSAYPGFGAALTLPENDHIDCCKPASRAAPAYQVVRDVVLHAIRAAAPSGG